MELSARCPHCGRGHPLGRYRRGAALWRARCPATGLHYGVTPPRYIMTFSIAFGIALGVIEGVLQGTGLRPLPRMAFGGLAAAVLATLPTLWLLCRPRPLSAETVERDEAKSAAR